ESSVSAMLPSCSIQQAAYPANTPFNSAMSRAPWFLAIFALMWARYDSAISAPGLRWHEAHAHSPVRDPDLSLLWFLRDEVGLTGTKFGCGQALCGACTVMVDKDAVRSCITSVSDVVSREVTTIEGLHPTGDHPVQMAWRELNVPQCGYCQAGQIMQAAALLIENPKPSHDQIRDAMSGNICRCGAYQRIENAVHLASTGV